MYLVLSVLSYIYRFKELEWWNLYNSCNVDSRYARRWNEMWWTGQIDRVCALAFFFCSGDAGAFLAYLQHFILFIIFFLSFFCLYIFHMSGGLATKHKNMKWISSAYAPFWNKYTCSSTHSTHTASKSLIFFIIELIRLYLHFSL